MLGIYTLVGKTPIPEADTIKWATWMEHADRQVERTELPDGVMVSTVFLGIDHNFSGTGEARLFETMVFGGKHDQETIRSTTWEKAEEAHKYMLGVVNE